METFSRRQAVATIAAACTISPFGVRAQGAYPNRPVKILVGVPPGSALDVSARTVAQLLSQELEQSFIVENKVGGSGIVSAVQAIKSPADGYTLLAGSSGIFAVNPTLYSKLPYDPVRDLEPITVINALPLFLVANPAFPANSVADVIRIAKEKPGSVSYGSSGAGITNHIAMEYFASSAGVKLLHVPYRGSPQALSDLMGGQIPLMFDTSSSVLPLINSGKFKVLAVSSARRSEVAPNVPTIAESGLPGFEATAWTALAAPAGTPSEIVEKLNRAAVKGLRSQETRTRFHTLGAEVVANSTAEFSAFLKSEIAKWGTIVRNSGAKAD